MLIHWKVKKIEKKVIEKVSTNAARQVHLSNLVNNVEEIDKNNHYLYKN